MSKETSNVSDNFARPNVERTILSHCLQNVRSLVEVKEKEVTGEMFLIEANRYIYYAIDYLYSKKQEPTPLAITEVLKDKHAKKVVEDFGGVEYLSILMEQRINPNSLEIFCEKLKQAYTKAKLYEICEQKKEFLLTDETEVMNPNELVENVEIALNELNTKVQQTTEIYKMGDNAEEVLKARAEFPNTVPGLEVGWKNFDYYTNGGQPGDLIMLCARAKTGKSTTLTNWAVNLSIKNKIPILYFDTEMNQREQEDRILSILSGIPHKEIVSGMYALDTDAGKASEKIELLKQAINQMKQGSYYHIYIPSFTIEKVNAIAKKFKLQYGIQAIFFDYLKFPASQLKSLKQAQEWQMLGFIASGLKDLAGTLNIPIYSACQENRSNPKELKKDEGNVGGSDRILQLATKLIFLVNKPEEAVIKENGVFGNQQLYIAFQRNGESDCPPINIDFDKPRLTQREVEF